MKESENQERDFKVTITDRFGPRLPLVVKARTHDEAIAIAKAQVKQAKLQFQYNKIMGAIQSPELHDVKAFINQRGVDPSVIQKCFSYSCDRLISLHESQYPIEVLKLHVEMLTALVNAGATLQGESCTNLVRLAGHLAENNDFSLLEAVVRSVILNNAETPLLVLALQVAYKFPLLHAVVKVLLDSWAKENARPPFSLRNKKTAFECAQEDAECLMLFLQFGANANGEWRREYKKFSLLHVVSSPQKYRRYEIVDGKAQLKFSEYDFVKLFIEKGAKLNKEWIVFCDDGESVLDRAILYGASLETVKLLIMHKAAILPRNLDKLTESICKKRLADKNVNTEEKKQWTTILHQFILQLWPQKFILRLDIVAFESLAVHFKCRLSQQLKAVVSHPNCPRRLSRFEEFLYFKKLFKSPAVMVMWMRKQSESPFHALPRDVAKIVARMTLWAPRIPIMAKSSATSFPTPNLQL